MDHLALSALGQDDHTFTNVVRKSILESRGKKVKNHGGLIVTVVCNGQPSFAQAVLQLLAGPLYALLGTESYKAFLQRPESIRLLVEGLANV